MDGGKKLELRRLPSTQRLGSAAELMEMTPGGTWINQANDKAPDGVPPTHTFLFWPIKPSDHPLRESAIMAPDLLGIYELIKAKLGDLWWQQSETDCWGLFICEHVGGVWLRCTVCKSFMSSSFTTKATSVSFSWNVEQEGGGGGNDSYSQFIGKTLILKIFLMTDRDAKISVYIGVIEKKKSASGNRFYDLIQTMDWLFG